MSKDTPSSGFFSKVVKFVRHPATTWSDLDLAGEARSDGQGQQALKEMIERKRRNDFVRKREFDMLRKLRARGPVPDPGRGGRPSFFHTSDSSAPDDRAGTLKKIDEIEAQMSMQWWKTKRGDSQQSVQAPAAPPEPGDTLHAYRTTVALDQPSTQAHFEASRNADYATTRGPSRTPTLQPPVQGEAGGFDSMTMPEIGATQPGELLDVDAFSASKYYGLDVQELALDPEIEEAAIRYASGDDKAAEQGLQDILTRKVSAGTTDEWMALFDLYRATGQVEAFDNHAMDFASRFSRSAPQWFSMPDEVASRAARVFQPSANLSRATWVAGAELDAHAVTLLGKTLERAPQPWVLDWSALTSAHPVAAVRLLKLMTDWSGQPVDLRFLGGQRLRDLLQTQTPSGNRSVDRIWWDLRLAALRVMHMGDDFELAALDFCVTYEVSPPSWEPPRCHFKSLAVTDDAQGDAAGLRHAPPSFVDTNPSVLPFAPGDLPVDLMGTASFMHQPVPVGELLGEILGDPQDHLERLDRLQGDAVARVVSCRNLIRVDFSAAGGILNWVSAHHAQGREIKFTEVHRLIAAFFHVIGITEHAKVVTRND
ncbi:MAG: STAS domain-containing protein [Burkholderiaceae bacterium]